MVFNLRRLEALHGDNIADHETVHSTYAQNGMSQKWPTERGVFVLNTNVLYDLSHSQDTKSWRRSLPCFSRLVDWLVGPTQHMLILIYSHPLGAAFLFTILSLDVGHSFCQRRSSTTMGSEA